MPQSIEVDQVSARYGRVTAVDNVSFSVTRGICALLGPNGAGKSTLIASIVGLKSFTGRIQVTEGDSVTERRDIKSRDVGYLPQSFDLAGNLRVGETVQYAAWCHGHSRRDSRRLGDKSIERVGLDSKVDHKVKTLSGGQRQRLGVACAIAHEPPILLLDEPTVGLDPTQRRGLRDLLVMISESTCVVMATHLLEDVRVIANQVVVMNGGTTVFDDTKERMATFGENHKLHGESSMEAAYRRLTDGPNSA